MKERLDFWHIILYLHNACHLLVTLGDAQNEIHNGGRQDGSCSLSNQIRSTHEIWRRVVSG